MIYEQGNILINAVNKQNEILERIALALEEMGKAEKSKAFNDFWKNVKTEDLAGR